jgi:serine/threonine-protein kinase
MSDPTVGPDLTGTVLAGKFRLVSLLGEGGMSTVWRAENTLVHKTVAIKLMHPEYARNPRTLERFRNEATSAGRIGNDHICDILDFGTAELGPYIVMEMLNGENLADLIERCGSMDAGLAVLIVRQALRGLIAAHRVNIIHRDLKPENVFLHYPEPGRLVVKLMDFGISKFSEEMGGGKTGVNVLMGTPEYMSPEQAEGAANVDVRTDIWAMGVMLYRAITGKDAFRSPTLAATLLAVTTKDPEPADTISQHVPPGLAAVVAACMAKSPDGRYPTAAALDEALKPYEAPAGTLPPPSQGGPGGGHPTLPAADQAAPSLPTYSSANQQLEMARAASVAGEQQAAAPPPAQAAPTAPGSGPAPQTWSSELAGPSSAEESWTMGESVGRGRPRSVSGGGSGIMIGLLILGLIVVGVGGYGFFFHGPGKDMLGQGDDGGVTTEADTAAGTTGAVAAAETGGDETAAAGDGTTAAAEETGAGEGTTGPEPATESSTTAAAAEESTTGAAAETTAAADEGTTGTTDAAETTGAAADDDGGKTSGGSGGGTVKVDKRKVFAAGGLYTPKQLGPKGSYTSAMGHCRSLRKRRFAGLKKWRAPKINEIKKFKGKVPKTLFWSVEQKDRRALAYNFFNNSAASLDPGSTKPRAMCVARN